MGWFDDAGDAIGGVFNGATNAIGGAFNKFINFGGNATGFSNASSFTPYKEFQAPQMDAGGLNNQIANNANLAKQQNVWNYNAAMASQAGVNPALAANFMGNNLANQNQQTSANVANLQAQNNYQTGLANMQSQYQTNALNSQNYNTAMSGNMMAGEKAADRGAGFIGGLLSGVGGSFTSLANAAQNSGGAAGAAGGGAALASDERMKEAPDAQDWSSHFHHYFTGGHMQQANNMQSVGPTPQQNLTDNQPQNKGPQKLSDESHTIESFLDTLTPYQYKYKPGTIADDGGEKHMGVMAQNLEKTQVGNNAVMDTPYGKMVDIKQLSSLLAAGMGNIHERLSKLEGTKNG